MITLLIEERSPERVTDFPGIVDLHELLARPEVQQNTCLWETGQGRLAAFALVDPFFNLAWEQAARLAGSSVEDEIVDWGVACARRMQQEMGVDSGLDAACRIEDTARIDFFKRYGFLPLPDRTVRMIRPLNELIAKPELPAGFQIRSVRGESEVEALVELHRAAFDSENMTVAERLAMMHTPEYDPTLDLVAAAPDGRLAAFCMGSISAQENTLSGRKDGYTDPVGTRPDFQRLGLARALLLTGLRLLQQRGIETARLGTSGENEAMQRAAYSVGFHLEYTKAWFRKKVL